MSKIIDAKGKPCPMPVIMAKAAITEGHEAFAIQVDSQTSVENLKRLAASQGYSANLREESGTFTLEFSKGGNTVQSVDTPAPPAAPSPVGNYVVFVGRGIIGDGDRELGTNLMRMFFYTLKSSDNLPSAVLFMNDGAKLPVLDEQVIEHLIDLISMGVDVLVCGACLNFYQLTDRPCAGTVSNMYDILSRMQAAAKVISL